MAVWMVRGGQHGEHEALALGQGFSIIVNEQNLGFVASANIGLGVDSSADTILLNSDTEVSGDWISRLQDCAYRTERAGTVTPFSNNGTICSYPVFMQSNELPPGWTARPSETQPEPPFFPMRYRNGDGVASQSPPK